MNLAVPMIIGAILGSRFWTVFFFEWEFYSQHPEEIIAVWHGGLSIQGGVIGAILVGIWYVRKHKISFWEMADLFVGWIYVTSKGVICRLGVLIAYGRRVFPN